MIVVITICGTTIAILPVVTIGHGLAVADHDNPTKNSRYDGESHEHTSLKKASLLNDRVTWLIQLSVQ